MFLNAFRNFRTETLFRIPFWALFLWLFALAGQPNLYHTPVSPLFDPLSNFIIQNAWLSRGTGFVLLSVSAYVFSSVINRHELLRPNHTCPPFSTFCS